MKTNYILLLCLFALALLFAWVVFSYPLREPRENAFAPRTSWEARTDESSAVTVTAIPVDLSASSGEWKIAVTMNTHSVELNHDLVTLATLVDDRGIEYRPLRWEGPTGGHHREGSLFFPAIIPRPSSVELRVDNLDSVPRRSFVWKL